MIGQAFVTMPGWLAFVGCFHKRVQFQVKDDRSLDFITALSTCMIFFYIHSQSTVFKHSIQHYLAIAVFQLRRVSWVKNPTRSAT